MRKRRLTRALGAVVVACCVLGSSVGFARGDGEGPRRGHGERGLKGPGLSEYAKELGLSEEVLAQIKKIRRASRDGSVDLKYELEKARNTLRDLLEEDSPRESAVMSQAEKVGGLQTRLRKARLRTMLQINKLLTPEQRIKFREFKRRKRGKKGRSRGPQSGGE